MTGLRGCCSQMDVQVDGEDLLVAQNCDHQWGRYTRDGKKIGSWGKRGAETDPTCFGSCCNPMNLRAGKNGEIYTAESEGIIKRFSAKGRSRGAVRSWTRRLPNWSSRCSSPRSAQRRAAASRTACSKYGAAGWRRRHSAIRQNSRLSIGG